MWQRIVNWRPDLLIVGIVVAAILAVVFPVSGPAAEAFSWATKIAIGLLFYLYGARLSPRRRSTVSNTGGYT